MHAHLARLHCRYRIRGGARPAAACTAQLDDVARRRLPDALSDALDRTLGDDPTVWVIRSVSGPVRLGLTSGETAQRLAEQWARQMARAVAVEIARGEGANVVRFRDEAEFVARFAAALIRDEAWNRWYFEAFSELRRHRRGDALHRVLAERPERLPAVLAALSRIESLETVLAALDPADRRRLWCDDLAAGRRADGNALRPVFAAAVGLIDRLGLWVAPKATDETLFRAFLDGDPPSPDWRETGSLADAVADAAGFLVTVGRLRTPDGAGAQPLPARLEAVVADLDWLDRPRLVALLGRLFAPPPRDPPAVAAAPRPPTPRHRVLLADLEAVVAAERTDRPEDADAAAATALRWYAALVAKAPAWAGDPLAVDVVDRLVRAWSGATIAAPAVDGADLGERPTDPPTLPGDTGEAWAVATAALVPAESAARHPRPAPRLHAAEREWLARITAAAGQTARCGSRCAGVFLLLRPILDLRLSPLLATIAGLGGETTTAAAPSALAALALRFAGDVAAGGEDLDPAVSLFAGAAPALRRSDLTAAWARVADDDLARCGRSLCGALAGLRLLAPSHLHLYRIDRPNRASLLLAADASADLWPLGCRVDGPEHTLDPVLAWLASWEDTTGVRPVVVVGDELASLGDVLRRRGAEIAPADENPSGPAARHREGREALDRALAAIGGGRVGREAADLFLDVAALAVLRAWSRWIKGFSRASPARLLDTFVRRAGRITVDARAIEIALPRRGPDVALELAGYLAEHAPVSWLGRRCVRYRQGG